MNGLLKTLGLLTLAAGVTAAAAAASDSREEPRPRQGAPRATEHRPAPRAPGRRPAPAPRTDAYRHRDGRSSHFVWRPQVRIGWGWGWGGWGVWGPGWSTWWDPYPWGPTPGWGPRAIVRGSGAGVGALDLDLSPERAEVWIDGEKIGVADDYDGFPDYLYLERGTYDVVFYLPGYKTQARQITVRPGVLIDIDDRLERGEAVLPTDLGPKTHVQRDLRLERDRQAQEEARQRESAPQQDSLDARAEPGRLALDIEPGDASVYLDGRFLGTGSDLGRLRAGLLVDAGEHTLEIVRPGYRAESRTIRVESGEQSAIDVALEPAPGGAVN